MKQPFLMTISECLVHFKTDAQQGLLLRKAKERLKKYGPNELAQASLDPWWRVFINQFLSPLIYILIAASIIIFFVGDDKRDAFIIAGILIFNAVIGTIQEGRTRTILATLHHFMPTDCIVIREGKRRLIKKAELVPGDIIVIQEGQRISADARLIQAYGLRVDEAALTGESAPVSKNIEPLSEKEAGITKTNMVFAGTYIHAGHGLAIVTTTGTQTQMGKIQHESLSLSTDVPLRHELDRLASTLLFAILGICGLLLLMGLYAGLSLQELLVTLTALFICVVPEGLPVVLTFVLVSGVYRMAKQRVLVKNMQAVEGLGRAQVIVIDKTGTLTRNEMLVSRVYADNSLITISGKGYFTEGSLFADGKKIEAVDQKSDLYQMGIATHLLSHAQITYMSQRGIFDVKGDPTDAALSVFAKKLGLSFPPDYQLIHEIPFDPLEHIHAGFYRHENHTTAYLIGAPEALFARAQSVSEEFKKNLEVLLLQGLRVVVVGMKEVDLPDSTCTDQTYQQSIKSGIKILGICAMEDSIRAEVSNIIKQARNAGLRIIMATGDHFKTALSVARTVGIYREGDDIIEHDELDQLSDEQLKDHLKDATVFSRVSAHNKVRIVSVLRQQGYIVAMTGDGINDVPALAAADLGIAMGSIGTEVAKEAADFILLDDSFANIIHAIEQGRHIFYTLRRVIIYFFATNCAEILIIVFAFVINLFNPSAPMPIPLMAAQILWLNLITDGFLDIALAAEPQEKGLLWRRQWLIRRMQLIDKSVFIKAFFTALPMAIGSFAIFLLVYPYDLALARTMALVSMACFQWFQAWSSRSEYRSLWQIGFFSNRWLIGATIAVVTLQISLIYVPFLQDLFHTVALTPFQWLFLITLSSSILWIEEMRKWALRRWWPIE